MTTAITKEDLELMRSSFTGNEKRGVRSPREIFSTEEAAAFLADEND